MKDGFVTSSIRYWVIAWLIGFVPRLHCLPHYYLYLNCIILMSVWIIIRSG